MSAPAAGVTRADVRSAVAAEEATAGRAGRVPAPWHEADWFADVRAVQDTARLSSAEAAPEAAVGAAATPARTTRWLDYKPFVSAVTAATRRRLAQVAPGLEVEELVPVLDEAGFVELAATRDALVARGSGGAMVLSLHGTSSAAALRSIEAHGYVVPGDLHPETGCVHGMANGNLFGDGIYSSTFADAAVFYAFSDALGRAQVLVNLVFLGNTCTMPFYSYKRGDGWGSGLLVPCDGQFNFNPADYLPPRGPDGRRRLPRPGEVDFVNGPSAQTTSTPRTYESVISANGHIIVSPASELVVPVLRLTVSAVWDGGAFADARFLSAPKNALTTAREARRILCLGARATGFAWESDNEDEGNSEDENQVGAGGGSRELFSPVDLWRLMLPEYRESPPLPHDAPVVSFNRVARDVYSVRLPAALAHAGVGASELAALERRARLAQNRAVQDEELRAPVSGQSATTGFGGGRRDDANPSLAALAARAMASGEKAALLEAARAVRLLPAESSRHIVLVPKEIMRDVEAAREFASFTDQLRATLPLVPAADDSQKTLGEILGVFWGRRHSAIVALRGADDLTTYCNRFGKQHGLADAPGRGELAGALDAALERVARDPDNARFTNTLHVVVPPAACADDALAVAERHRVPLRTKAVIVRLIFLTHSAVEFSALDASRAHEAGITKAPATRPARTTAAAAAAAAPLVAITGAVAIAPKRKPTGVTPADARDLMESAQAVKFRSFVRLKVELQTVHAEERLALFVVQASDAGMPASGAAVAAASSASGAVADGKPLGEVLNDVVNANRELGPGGAQTRHFLQLSQPIIGHGFLNGLSSQPTPHVSTAGPLLYKGRPVKCLHVDGVLCRARFTTALDLDTARTALLAQLGQFRNEAVGGDRSLARRCMPLVEAICSSVVRSLERTAMFVADRVSALPHAPLPPPLWAPTNVEREAEVEARAIAAEAEARRLESIAATGSTAAAASALDADADAVAGENGLADADADGDVRLPVAVSPPPPPLTTGRAVLRDGWESSTMFCLPYFFHRTLVPGGLVAWSLPPSGAELAKQAARDSKAAARARAADPELAAMRRAYVVARREAKAARAIAAGRVSRKWREQSGLVMVEEALEVAPDWSPRHRGEALHFLKLARSLLSRVAGVAADMSAFGAMDGIGAEAFRRLSRMRFGRAVATRAGTIDVNAVAVELGLPESERHVLGRGAAAALAVAPMAGVPIEVQRSAASEVEPWQTIVLFVGSRLDAPFARAYTAVAHATDTAPVATDARATDVLPLTGVTPHVGRMAHAWILTRTPFLPVAGQRTALTAAAWVIAIEQLFREFNPPSRRPGPPPDVAQLQAIEERLASRARIVIALTRRVRYLVGKYAEAAEPFLDRIAEPAATPATIAGSLSTSHGILSVCLALGALSLRRAAPLVRAAAPLPAADRGNNKRNSNCRSTEDAARAPLRSLPFALLAECMSRACRAYLSVSGVQPAALIRSVLGISLRQTNPDAFGLNVERAVRVTGRFNNRRLSNVTPYALVAVFGFLQVWHGNGDGGVGTEEPTVEAVLEAFRSRMVSMRNFLRAHLGPEVSGPATQLALFLQGTKFARGRTRVSGEGLVGPNPQEIVQAHIDEQLAHVRSAREIARLAAECRSLRHRSRAAEAMALREVHTAPRIFSHGEVVTLNERRPADDQLVLLSSGLLRDHCCYPMCPQFLVNQATLADRQAYALAAGATGRGIWNSKRVSAARASALRARRGLQRHLELDRAFGNNVPSFHLIAVSVARRGLSRAEFDLDVLAAIERAPRLRAFVERVGEERVKLNLDAVWEQETLRDKASGLSAPAWRLHARN